ncbi:MAG TPA: 2-amino-3,7-dideoxy-D-threo-hept-6-ulosonate synthase [Bacillota bacterium]|nr:2-amino-3,7-dideoxy-D-threo-hept-6-ulosonate synthase [Bacillota bacterium]
MIGKIKRLNRLFNNSGNIILIPMDHGVTLGPIKGLSNMKQSIDRLIKNGADSILLHKGMIMHNYNLLRDKNIGLIMHLSGSTSIGANPDYKIITGSIYEAISMGCDAVSIHINIGTNKEPEMLKDFAQISSECYKYGIPLLAMIYIRGGKITNEYDKNLVKHAARIGAELGADVVKVNYTGDIESFHEVVDSCPVPVIIAGGEKINDDVLIFKMVADAIQAGAKGISIGRNIFQHENIEVMLKIMSLIIHNKEPFDRVIDTYREMIKEKSLVAATKE